MVSVEEARELSSRALKDKLSSTGDMSDAEALRRYREKTQLNKPKDGIRKSLVQRQTETGDDGDAFRASERIVKSTQQVTDSHPPALKARRNKCQEDLDRDAASIFQLDKEMAEFERKLSLIESHRSHCASQRDSLKQVLCDSKLQSAQLVKECGARAAKNRKDADRNDRKVASENLRADRGFASGSGSTCTAREARIRASSRMGSTGGTQLSTLRMDTGALSLATLPNLPTHSANATQTLSQVKSSYL
ncbi:hypothetical protein M885DRAFT_611306 [Pelagophyceae sp. CCMP2097]|nr:hypothetical protein M885DRAFT_611306 [Pelagophyceae sp. CCMP2097]